MKFYTVDFDFVSNCQDFDYYFKSSFKDLKRILTLNPTFYDPQNYNEITVEWDLITDDNITFIIHDYDTGFMYDEDDVIEWYIETEKEEDSKKIYEFITNKL